MSPVDQRIQNLFLSDSTALAISMVAVWAMVIFAATAVSAVTENPMVKTVLLTSALLICIFATAALAAVFVHIKRNRLAIYTEDILASTGQ